MKLMLTVMLVLLVAVFLVSCGKQSTMKPKQHNQIDRDFAATIRKTTAPDVFEVTVKKTNRKTDKAIGSFPVIVDLTLTSDSGKVYTGESKERRETAVYAKEVGDTFDTLRKPGAELLTGRVRLLKSKLPPGSYTVQPRVRIQEVGKDALGGPYAGGTVAVPATNSVQAEVQ